MIRLRKEDRIPTEIMAVAVCIAGMVMYRFIGWVVDALWQSIPEYVMILIAGLSALAVSLIFSFFYYSFVRRIKAGRLWKDSVVRRSGQAAARGARYAYRHWDIVGSFWDLCAFAYMCDVRGSFWQGKREQRDEQAGSGIDLPDFCGRSCGGGDLVSFRSGKAGHIGRHT